MTIKLARLAGVALALMFASLCAAAQTAAPQQDATPDAAGVSRTDADEDFELNISERHIVKESFAASTEVELNGAGEQGLNLRVGVAVGAESIDVLLRNVRGRVRFRASLAPLVRRTGARRTEAAPPSP